MTDKDTGAFRVSSHPMLGERRDADVTRVIVDGREYHGFVGEPIAMTLLAHGIRSARSTAETGTARGYFCGVGRCPDCAMTVDGELNVMTCITPLKPGMIVRTQQGLGTWEEAE